MTQFSEVTVEWHGLTAQGWRDRGYPSIAEEMERLQNEVNEVARATDRTPPEIYVHGARASSLQQIIDFLTGDDHDRSKVQIFTNGRFWDFEEVVSRD